MIEKVNIKNYRSIKNSGDVNFNSSIFVLAGQNESGKSSILEALAAYENDEFNRDSLNFEEEHNGNYIQEISCTYTVEDNEYFISRLEDIVREDFSIGEEVNFLDKVKLSKIDKYTITKRFNYENNSLETILSPNIVNLVKNSIKKIEKIETVEGQEIKDNKLTLDLEGKEEDIAYSFFRTSPQIVLFNDFSDLLPDKILVSDLENNNENAQGYNAVRNLEDLLNKDFVSISKLQRNHKNSTTAIEQENLSIKFQKAWKQRIHKDGDLKIGFAIENESVEGTAVPTIFFTLETKDNVPLEPRKRSKGMIWFLSAWLDLKAREDNNKLVVLYDEPGLYLHVKAHKDILDLFLELSEKGHQIIYSTHSPTLIDTSKLYNIGLVLNTETQGTIIEGLTTSKINTEYKEDALQPIAEAMGLEPLKEFSILSKKNVMLEGLSDFWYFQAMLKVLEKKVDYKFVPGIGIKDSKINQLISFCIGYSLEWLLVMDGGDLPITKELELRQELFNNDKAESEKRILLLKEKEIEDIFSVDDLQLVDTRIKKEDKRIASQIIGKKRKIIFARDFAKQVDEGLINKNNIKQETLNSFSEIFNWIDKQFNE